MWANLPAEDSRMNLESTYSPNSIEEKWRNLWEQEQSGKALGHGDAYCIILPPPNVTGTLHMGHGFQITLMDILIRQHRMLGHNTHWQVGSDHAGIATQMVVERKLATENISRYDLGREAFVQKVWEWKEESGNTIMRQIRRLGASVDWDKERFTLDAGMCAAVNKAFCDLYDEGLIYRGRKLVNWDPKLNTALSDLEVINTEEQGHIWTIRYPLADGDDYIEVATTRPETMLGDVAVAIHPLHPRAMELKDKKLALPLTDRLIPIILDDYVDPEFGTGCVKITPAHDFNDYEMGRRHNLAMINILTLDAHLNDNVPTKYRGLSTTAAREIICADLQAQGLLIEVKNHTLQVPRGDRSNAIIEPMLTDQWFMQMRAMADAAMAAVTNEQLKFTPANWTKTYMLWLKEIQDWCIGRQLWWGHRIPAWYDADGNIYVAQDEMQVRAKYNLAADVALTQETDVLDTWFSAALWPFATLGWPNTDADFYQTFYPSQVLVTGFDIIFFWVARMVMLGLKLTGKVPFANVYVTGLIRDAEGQKMSKSKGNILDPIDLIDGISLADLTQQRTQSLMQPHMLDKITKKTAMEFPEGIAAYGTDALRFTFCALASTGRDINFDIGRISGYRNFCNKLWNATRYVIMQTEDYDGSAYSAESLIDNWITHELNNTINYVVKALSNYRFDLAAQELYEFFWNKFCDWYLELSKVILFDATIDNKDKQATKCTMLTVLATYMRLLHPIMPFITAEAWQKISGILTGNENANILQAGYPTATLQSKPSSSMQWLQDTITAIRTMRSELNIKPKQEVAIYLQSNNTQDKKHAEECGNLLCKMAKVAKIYWCDALNFAPEPNAVQVVGTMNIFMPLAGLIDTAAEVARLAKELTKLTKEFHKRAEKLDNATYLAKAPAEVIAKEQQAHQEVCHCINKIEEQLAQLRNM
jgi:valyl-tRNA synthetase